jgi:tetratricopeptide (TPR) repeat protein
VSLLLEALKKAERSKHEYSSQAGDPGRDELELVDQRAGTAHGQDAPEAGTGNGGTQRSREAADILFSAKQRKPAGRNLVLGGLIVLVVIGAAGGAYVWYEISRTTRTQVAAAPRMPIQAAPPAPQPQAPAMAEPAPAPEPAAVAGGGVSLASAPISSSPAPATSPLPARPSAREGAPDEPPKARRGPQPPSEPEDVPSAIRIRRTQSAPQLDADIAAGYEALQAGNISAAHDSYALALRRDPANRDALMGLAAAALKGGNTREAQRAYQRMLELDPRDPVANAALVALRPQADPALAESRLKTLISQHPESAALNFTLGNVLAGQARWAEAQQAYFQAFSIDPSNADYAFNNAVSLDQLGQRKLAEDYYGRALALASGGPANFDRAQASRRLQELAQSR